jgi:hypothetical protein
VVVTHFGDDHRTAYTGHGVRCPHLDNIPGPHPFTRDGNSDPSASEVHRRDVRRLGNRDDAMLADGNDRVASEQHSSDGIRPGRDAILNEDAVAEPQRRRLSDRGADHSHWTVDVRDDADTFLSRQARCEDQW